MKRKRIKGTSKHQNIEMGFWSIIGKDGSEYRPINMPEQLKSEGSEVEVVISEIEEEMSFIMWGKAVKIISFQTIMSE
jgi:hypothetical protein